MNMVRGGTMITHGAGAVRSVAGVLGGLLPIATKSIANSVTGAARDRAMIEGVSRVMGQTMDGLPDEIIKKISEGVINNPEVAKVLKNSLRDVGVDISHVLIREALGQLQKFCMNHRYKIWTVISVMALFTIRVVDLIMTRGIVTDTGAKITFKGMSLASRKTLKTLQTVARHVKRMGTPNSPKQRVVLLIFYVLMFSVLASAGRPVLGAVVGMVTPYLTRPVRGGVKNVTNVRNFVNNSVARFTM